MDKSMVRTIARNELLGMSRDGRFRTLGAITLILLTVALLFGWRNYSAVAAQHGQAQKATRQQWLHQGAKNPHSAAHYGVYAFKPVMPLALVDRGVEAYTGVAVWLEAHKQNEFRYRPAQDASAASRLGELTGAMVLQVLAPLLILLAGFSVFTSERESGTLRQLLSLGVSRASLAAGKALGVAAAMAALFVPAAIVGSLALLLASGQADLLASVPRWIGLSAAYSLYFSAFAALTLAVSATAPSSRVSLLVLLGFWTLNCLVAPRAASDIARSLRPAPSAFAFANRIEQELKNGVDGHDPADLRTQRLERELLRKYNVSRIEDLPVNFNGIRLQEGENHGNEVFDRAYGELWAKFDEQDAVHQAIGWVFPSLAIRRVSMGFAGSDFPHHSHFAKAAEEYRRGIQRTMNNDLVHNASNRSPYMAGDDLWRKVPEFTYVSPDAGWVTARQWQSLLALACWSAAGVFLVFRAAARMRAV